MSPRALGIALLAIAAFMGLGFARSDASLAAPATLGALLIAVVLPAVAGLALLTGRLEWGAGSRSRREELRANTIEAEILRMATQQQGKLTAVEVATALALPVEQAKAALDALVSREVAELEITDAGVIVYAFHDAKHLGGKQSSRGILDA